MTSSGNIKRVVIVIVEGISDQVTFENYLNALCKDKAIFFSVYKGDLLTDYSKDTESVNDILKQSFMNALIQ